MTVFPQKAKRWDVRTEFDVSGDREGLLGHNLVSKILREPIHACYRQMRHGGLAAALPSFGLSNCLCPRINVWDA